MQAEIPAYTAFHSTIVSSYCLTDCFILLTVQFTFGYGVGGEYPMAAGSAAERAEAKGRASARKRGREVPTLLLPQPLASSVACFASMVSCIKLACTFLRSSSGRDCMSVEPPPQSLSETEFPCLCWEEFVMSSLYFATVLTCLVVACACPCNHKFVHAMCNHSCFSTGFSTCVMRRWC